MFLHLKLGIYLCSSNVCYLYKCGFLPQNISNLVESGFKTVQRSFVISTQYTSGRCHIGWTRSTCYNGYLWRDHYDHFNIIWQHGVRLLAEQAVAKGKHGLVQFMKLPQLPLYLLWQLMIFWNEWIQAWKRYLAYCHDLLGLFLKKKRRF